MQILPKKQRPAAENDFSFDVQTPDGVYDAVVFHNKDGVCDDGSEKLIVFFGLPKTGGAVSLHAKIGTRSLEQAIRVLAPQLEDSGGAVDEGCLRGIFCRVKIKNREYNHRNFCGVDAVLDLDPSSPAAPSGAADESPF